MSQETRYAIYLLPSQDSPLANAGAEWLGWDVFKGAPFAHPDRYQLSAADIEVLTTSPRHYGFHGTLKAPFRLKEGLGELEIRAAFKDFVRCHSAQSYPDLEISKLDSFFALTPKSSGNGLSTLAADVVRHFEPLRAPISKREYEKRNPHLLTDRQQSYLTEWGYPYVFEEFRFHITLSNKIADAYLNSKVAEALNTHFPESLLNESDDFCIALCVEENKQPFKMLASSSVNILLPESMCHVS